jgi:hypothetical protein
MVGVGESEDAFEFLVDGGRQGEGVELVALAPELGGIDCGK